MAAHSCPAPLCGKQCKRLEGLEQHWSARHLTALGRLSDYVNSVNRSSDATVGDQGGQAQCADCEAEATSATGATADAQTVTDMQAEICRAAMQQIDECKYKYFEGDASVQRSKELVGGIMAAIKPALRAAVQPHLVGGVEADDLIEPVLNALDMIKSVKREAGFRKVKTARGTPAPSHLPHPPSSPPLPHHHRAPRCRPCRGRCHCHPHPCPCPHPLPHHPHHLRHSPPPSPPPLPRRHPLLPAISSPPTLLTTSPTISAHGLRPQSPPTVSAHGLLPRSPPMATSHGHLSHGSPLRLDGRLSGETHPSFVCTLESWALESTLQVLL